MKHTTTPQKKKKKKKTEGSSYFVFINYQVTHLTLFGKKRIEERNTLDLFTYENFIDNEILQKKFT